MLKYTKWMLAIVACITLTLTPEQAQNLEHLDQSPYFNTALISDVIYINAVLAQDGFKPVTFKSIDGIKLNGLLLERPNAKVTVICCAGFYPGRKEGMSSFFKLVPDYCNVLLFDARGHGKSDGKFLSSLHKYGRHEYKDIVGAAEFVHTTTQKPIILLGVCIGTLHATHAILHLQKDTRANKPSVIGFVCDSGVGSIKEVAQLPVNRINDVMLPNALSKFYSDKSPEKIRTKWGYTIAKCIAAPVTVSTGALINVSLMGREKHTNTFDKIHLVECPIFFIHSKDDDGTPFASAVRLADKAKHKECWWIETSKHGCNHLKHKQEYQKRLCGFIDQISNA